MYTHSSKIRITYAETDLMGFVYYGNYPRFYEIGRTEMIRSLGMTYKEMEERGVLMPVRSLQCKYLLPAHYDDLLTITTSIREMPRSKIVFFYDIFNEKGELIHQAETVLCFINAKTNRVVRAPYYLTEKLNPYFEDK